MKWFSDLTGFGFITPDDGGVDLFAHHSAIDGGYSLRETQKVSYESTSGPRGPTALKITPL